MKRFTLRILSIGLYFILMLWLLNFQFCLLLDGKSLLLVLCGTLLLTAGCYKRDMSKQELQGCVLWNSTIAGFLTTFMLLFSTLYGSTDSKSPFPSIALCLRPLLYSFILQVLLKPFPIPEENNQAPSVTEGTAISEEGASTGAIRSLLLRCQLTQRELEIALCILDGMPNKLIADRLCISESTVKKHSGSLYKKLGVTNREQLKQYINSAVRS